MIGCCRDYLEVMPPIFCSTRLGIPNLPDPERRNPPMINYVVGAIVIVVVVFAVRAMFKNMK